MRGILKITDLTIGEEIQYENYSFLILNVGALALTLKVLPRGPLLAQERGYHEGAIWVFRRPGERVRGVCVCVCVCVCV